MVQTTSRQAVHNNDVRSRPIIPAQVAERLQVKEGRVIQWLRDGNLKGFKIDRKWRTTTLHLNEFLDARANQQPR